MMFCVSKNHLDQLLIRPAILLAVAAACLFLSSQPQAVAQQNASVALEEIVVSARKREESVQDVPVSVSVFSRDLLVDAGILSVNDLFEMTPGLSINTQFGDRISTTPGIRGVKSLEISVNRQKVNTFVDGIPLVGQQATAGFDALAGVEVYRGPQSAAFGRATFAGAINYITPDPTEEFTGNASVWTSDLGRNRVVLGFGGPISDRVGYRIDFNADQYEGDDSWVSADGYRLGGTSSQEVAVKLQFAPTDTFDGEFRISRRETDDQHVARYMVQDFANCSNFTGPTGVRYFRGEFDCDLSIPSDGVRVRMGTSEGYVAGPGTGGFTKERLDQYAASHEITDPGTAFERDRIQGELNWSVGDSSLQLLSLYSQESFQRSMDFDTSATPLLIVGMGPVLFAGMNVFHISDPGQVDESYIEARWVSPEDRRLRYVLGASYYNYDYLTEIYTQFAALSQGTAEVLGVRPFQIFSETAENVGVFFNLIYDLSDQTTISLEGRQQTDDISNVNSVSGARFGNKTTSFQPRLAINHYLNDEWSIYAQYAEGNNAAGVNVNFTNSGTILALQDAQAAGQVTYDANTFLEFEEESLTSFEIGAKAALIDGRLQLATALYVMKWEDMIQPYNLNWDGPWNNGTSPNAVNFNNGTPWPFPFVFSRTQLNQGTAETVGLEAEINWIMNDNWDARLTGTMLNAEYTDFCALFPVAELRFTPDFTTQDGAAYNCVYVNGNDFVLQPNLSYTAGVTYRSQLGDSIWEWSVRGDLRHTGSSFYDPLNYLEIPATDIVNLALNFNNSNGWHIRAFVYNLLGEDTPLDFQEHEDWAVAMNGSVVGLRVAPRSPREIGFLLGYNF